MGKPIPCSPHNKPNEMSILPYILEKNLAKDRVRIYTEVFLTSDSRFSSHYPAVSCWGGYQRTVTSSLEMWGA
jgi:hypothetical protein